MLNGGTAEWANDLQRSPGQDSHTSGTRRPPTKLFEEGIQPLVDAGRLGALFFQFPWSFKNEPEMGTTA